MAEVDVNIDINVENNSSYEINQITNNVIHLHQAVQQQTKQNDKWSESVKRMAKAGLSAARAVGKVAASVAAVAAAAGPATSGLLAAGKAVAVFGRSLAGLSALAAFIPSLIGAVGLLVGTFKLVKPGFAKAFEPITRQFVDAEGNASKLTQRLRDVATAGVKPLAEQFVKLNMPAIAGGMERISKQLGAIVIHSLRWLNTADGQSAIKTIVDATATAFEKLQPKISILIENLGKLAGRAGDPAIKGLGDLIGRIVDKLTEWASTTSAEDISKALADLAGYGVKIRQVFGAVRDVGRWLAENEGAIKHFSDVAAGAAITLGVATGNIPAVIAGSVALIVNHWDQLKGVFKGSAGWLGDTLTAWKNDAGRIKVFESLMNAVNGFKEQFARATGAIGPQWKEFVSELKAAWQEWAPLIAAWWNTGGREAFKAAGLALGIFVMLLLQAATTTAQVATTIAQAFKVMVSVVLNVLGLIITGAAKAFSWIPGMGPKLEAASRAFEDFKNRVNNSLDGIDPIKTIRINAQVYVTGGGSVAGGVDQRTGNSRNAGLSGLTSWQRVAAAFAGERGGTSRTGGPAPLTATVQNVVMLDGRPFRSYTDSVALAERRRAAWLLKTGRR